QDPQAGKIVISIDEGQRFMAGDVLVTGTKTIDAAWLAQELSPAGEADGPRPAVKKKGVCWPIGKPAWFDPESLVTLRRRVETLLSERGLVLANFTLEAKPDPEQGLATLVIDFHDEGVPAKIGEIQVTGNDRSSREQVLRFLDLQTGMLLTQDVTDRINDRLTNSGRFLKSHFKTLLPTKAGEPLRLQINVSEYDQAPPLDQPLSREEKALVRFSRWARQFEDGDDDFLLQITSEEGVLELVVSPRHGILAQVRGVHDGDDASQAAPFQFAYLATDDEIGMFSLKRQRKIAAIPPPSRLIANLEVEIHDDQPPFEGQGQLKAGLGMRPKTGAGRHFVVGIKQTAAAALALAHLEDSHCTWEGDVLKVEYGDRCLRIDATTGRIIELLFPTTPEPDEGQWRFTVSQGEFQRRAAAIKLAAADFPNEADAAMPMSCVSKFLYDEVLAWNMLADDPDFRRGVTIGRKVTDLGLFEPLDEVLAAACRPAPARDEFSVPVALWAGDEVEDDLSRLVRRCALGWGIPAGDGLLPRDTWAWHLWREMTFHYAQLAKTAGEQAGGVQPLGGWGAVACLVMSQLTPGADDATSAALASEGLQRLTLDEFRRDYAALLDHESFLGRYVWKLVEVVRGLDDED
ncbi:MAG TPA: hypothetical protein VGX76_22000, partial [Pirellulales bacterium]|nr:hypothetical protein [Pirellulales bacterium]